MPNVNEAENARDEAHLIARMAYSEAVRNGLDEDAAQAAFDEALEAAM